MSNSEMTVGAVFHEEARLQDRVRGVEGLIQQMWRRHDNPYQAMLSWIRALAHIPQFLEEVYGLRKGCGRKLRGIMEQEILAVVTHGDQPLYIPGNMYTLRGSCSFDMARIRYGGVPAPMGHYGDYLPTRPGLLLEKIVPRGPMNELLPGQMDVVRWRLLRQLEQVLRRGDRPPRGRPRIWVHEVPVTSPNVLHVYLGAGRASRLQYKSKQTPIGRSIGQLILRLGRDLASSGRVVTLPFKGVLRAMQGKDAARLTQDEVRKKIGTLKSYASRVNDALKRVGLATGGAGRIRIDTVGMAFQWSLPASLQQVSRAKSLEELDLLSHPAHPGAAQGEASAPIGIRQ